MKFSGTLWRLLVLLERLLIIIIIIIIFIIIISPWEFYVGLGRSEVRNEE